MHVSRHKGRIAAGLAALLLIAGTASAVVVKGRGELRAAGHGAAVLDFRGEATLHGVGLAVVDPHVVVETDGVRHVTRLADGRVLYEGFGRIHVRSLHERTRLEAAGAKMRLRARGVGVAFLKGVGHFDTADAEGSWDPEVSIEFDEDEE